MIKKDMKKAKAEFSKICTSKKSLSSNALLRAEKFFTTLMSFGHNLIGRNGEYY